MKDTLQKYYNIYAEILEYDPEFYANINSVTVDWKYRRHQDLLKFNNALLDGNENVAIQIVKELAVDVVSKIQQLDPEQLVEQFDQLQVAVKLMKEINVLYATWLKDFYENFLLKFLSHGLFEDDELTPENVHPNFFIELDKSAKYMKSYRYKIGKGSLAGIKTADLRMGNDILIMEDVNQFFGYLKNTSQEDNVVYAHIILKIEERVDLSHFLVAITYNGHSFISTDAPSFGTPQNKATTRNPRRHMESKYDNLAFPYILIDQLDEIRKENTTLAKYGAYSFELYKKPIKQFDAYCKLFIIGIADILRNEAEAITDDVMLLSDYITTKLIGAPLEITESDDRLFVGHHEIHKRQLVEILGTLENTETGIVKVGAELVQSSKYYDKNWLATPADLEKLSKWMALDTKRQDTNDKLIKKFGSTTVKDKALEWLNKELNKKGNFERLWPYIFSANEVHFEILDLFDKQFDKDGKRLSFVISEDNDDVEYRRVVNMFNNRTHYFTQVRLGFDTEGIRERSEMWRQGNASVKSYDDYIWRDTCDCCGKVRNNVVKYFRILHWKQLCFLLDLKQEQLPAYLRAYKADQLIPYYGNPILSEVHPMSLLKHPSWTEFQNGITCTVHMCKRCVNKLEKKHRIADDTLIKHNGELIKFSKDESSLGFMPAY